MPQSIAAYLENGRSFQKADEEKRDILALYRDDIEIDFLISNKSKTRYKIYYIEVKSTERYSINSLGRFAEKFRERIGQAYVIDTKNYRRKDDVVYMPVYVTMCL